MSRAALAARKVLHTLQIDDLKFLAFLPEICIERGAYVREGHLEGAEARLTRGGNFGVITVNPSNSSAARTRFSIAHELGHFELHKFVKSAVNCDVMALNNWADRREQRLRECEANEFACELLMPKKFIKPEINGLRPSINALEALSIKYQTSLLATTQRFIDLTDLACAAVFFEKRGHIEYTWSSPLFERQQFKIEGRVDFDTAAFKAVIGQPLSDTMAEIPAQRWFSVSPNLADVTILEQARYFPRLQRGMALLWVNSNQLLRNW